jgi:hypothetical protein
MKIRLKSPQYPQTQATAILLSDMHLGHINNVCKC